METIHVYRKLLRNGVEIKLKKKTFNTLYHQPVWDKFPLSLRKLFADSLAYLATWQLPFIEEVKTIYHFPHPPTEPIFFKMLLYCLPMTIFESEGITTSEIIKKFFNISFQTQFKGANHNYSGKKVKKALKEKAVVLFSFGKDSLLNYCLLKEMKIPQVLVFMQEPHSKFENYHKKRLAEKFLEQNNEEIEFFPLQIGKLRQETNFAWGWDILLTQYIFLLLPYLFYYQTKYLFLGNEQSCNLNITDSENYLVNPVFEQSVSAMQLQHDIPKLFSIQTHIGSLIEPVHEIFITYILHRRYPQIGRFQTSCHAETIQAKTRRWCGHCEKCARMYVFFMALNINPKKAGFYRNDMFSEKKSKYYVLFDNANSSVYGGSGLGRDEQLLAFYLAYKNKTKGELIERFKKEYLEEAERRKKGLIEEFSGIHSSFSLPPKLRKKVLKIFQKERESFLKQFF